MPGFQNQNPTHNEKRLHCDCGSWDWKIQMEVYLTAPLYICAACGESVTFNGVEHMIRKEHENANT